MKYLPFERIIYRTNLSEQEVVKRLSDFIEPKKFSWGKKTTKEYEGFVTNSSFEINRIIDYRNSFLPQISGTFKENNGVTQIEVTMKLHVLVLVFLIVWCGFALLFLIGMGVAVGIAEEKISLVLFIPVFMLLFVYALTMFGFKSESKKSREFLKKSFEAEIINE
ncbi:hypothetical protein [Chryseobacterium vrystaatense]|uniref:Uncharacterized protein n=1 Tax=Chryseobacterium vrystaatense TaxID=307480 RepID=A0A1M5AY59_9FLAO|nr:hypothetical protein [Chryseobacterium vrystaatense]SHF35155.1 hypothetical protein SAMN02787073_2066 [Chryseobacterium vrystaatense]